MTKRKCISIHEKAKISQGYLNELFEEWFWHLEMGIGTLPWLPSPLPSQIPFS